MATTTADREAARQQRDLLRQQRKRRREYERQLKLRQQQAESLRRRTAADYARRSASLKGIYGLYGTLNSGVAGQTLGELDVEGARAQGDIAANLASDLLAAQLQQNMYNEGQTLDWAKFWADQDRARRGDTLEEQRLALETELGRGRLGLDTSRLAQEAEQAKLSREHELGVLGKTQEFEAGEAAKGRDFQSSEAAKGREFTGEQARLGREHELGVLGQTQQFQAEQAQLGREQDTATQLREIEYRASEGKLSREQEQLMAELRARLEAEAQQREYGYRTQEAEAGREFQASESALSRAHEADMQDRQLAVEIRRLAAEMADREAARGDARDENQMRFAIQLQQLAAQIEDNRTRNQIELQRLAQSMQSDQTAQMLNLLRAGGELGVGNPLLAAVWERIMGSPAPTTSGSYAGMPSGSYTGMAAGSPASPGYLMPAENRSAQQEFDLMGQWWDRARGQAAENWQALPEADRRAILYGGGGGRQPTDLDYYQAQTDRMNAISRMGGSTGGRDTRNALADLNDQDRRGVEKILEFARTGRAPNISRAGLLYWIDRAVNLGIIDAAESRRLERMITPAG